MIDYNYLNIKYIYKMDLINDFIPDMIESITDLNETEI